LGRQLIGSGQAQKNRFASGDAVDDSGYFYPGVQFGLTCQWEPYEGKTSDNARTCAAAASTDEDRVTAAFRNYVNCPQYERDKVMARRQMLPPMQAGQSLDAYLHELQAPDFMKPFYLILTLTLALSPARHAEALHCLKRSWSTSYGGGKVINGLLFAGRHVVCESQDDIRMPPGHEGPMLQGVHANALFGFILFESAFGDAMMACSPPGRLAPVSEVLALQRFLFKLCEVRKTNVAGLPRHRKWAKSVRRRREKSKEFKDKIIELWWRRGS
jgi:hypothetical protein